MHHLLILLISLTISLGALAGAEKQKNLRFPILIDQLMKGDTHYAVSILKPETVEKKYPELWDMDTLGFRKKQNVLFLVGKSVQVVNKPAGFFDNQNLSDEKFIRHTLGGQEVSKLKDRLFSIRVPGGPSYKLKTFFDSDDISTLPNSRVIRAVTQAKKFDVISQGSSTTLVKEMYDFSSEIEGAVSVSSFVPLKEEKTLILTYTVTAIKKPIGSKKALKQSFLDETLATRELINSYR